MPLFVVFMLTDNDQPAMPGWQPRKCSNPMFLTVAASELFWQR